MSSSTLVPVYQFIGRLYASISSINHAHYILCLICDMVVVKSLYITVLIHKEQFAFQVHSLKITMQLGFWGTSDGLLSCKASFFSCIAS